jgi:hippurate hydrolase
LPIDELVALYEHFHRHPELSLHEEQTASRLADELERRGIEVTRKVGGHGLVGVLRNGEGPVLLVRADMDALPIAEDTGLPYSSEVRGQAADGQPIGVMHACGHDLHMACLVGVAGWAANHRESWRGTILFVGQPAEERGGGAKMMLAAGLYERFPVPAFALALHTMAELPTGVIGYREGYAMANVDSVDITMYGRGGHGSAPHRTIDPIVQAARLVNDLQSIVAREIDPLEAAVVTVGSIHGGSKHNIIPDRCQLQLTLRSYSPAVREHLLAAVKRHAEAVALGARAPAPTVEYSEPLPAVRNDPGLTRRVVAALQRELGEERVQEVPQVMGAEDFGLFGNERIPVCMLRVGTVDPGRLERLLAQDALPSLHSSKYYPDARPAIATGVRALAAALRDLLQ